MRSRPLLLSSFGLFLLFLSFWPRRLVCLRVVISFISSIWIFLLKSPIGSDQSLARSRRKSFFCVEAQMSRTSGAKKEAEIRKKHIMSKDLRALLEDFFRIKPPIFSIKRQYYCISVEKKGKSKNIKKTSNRIHHRVI